jgi:hypothetical protein
MPPATTIISAKIANAAPLCAKPISLKLIFFIVFTLQ